MLDGQHHRVDGPIYARTAHDGFGQKDWKMISAESSLMLPHPLSLPWMTLSVRGLK